MPIDKTKINQQIAQMIFEADLAGQLEASINEFLSNINDIINRSINNISPEVVRSIVKSVLLEKSDSIKLVVEKTLTEDKIQEITQKVLDKLGQ